MHLLDQLFQAPEVFAQARFGILIGVIEQPDRAMPAARAKVAQQFQIQFSLAEWQDQFSILPRVPSGQRPYDLQSRRPGCRFPVSPRSSRHCRIAMARSENPPPPGVPS